MTTTRCIITCRSRTTRVRFTNKQRHETILWFDPEPGYFNNLLIVRIKSMFYIYCKYQCNRSHITFGTGTRTHDRNSRILCLVSWRSVPKVVAEDSLLHCLLLLELLYPRLCRARMIKASATTMVRSWRCLSAAASYNRSGTTRTVRRDTKAVARTVSSSSSSLKAPFIGTRSEHTRNLSSNVQQQLLKIDGDNNMSIANQQKSSLDDMGHMDVPEHEFVAGCSFLRKVALGTPPKELQAAFDVPKLVNFRDYDRRTGTFACKNGLCSDPYIPAIRFSSFDNDPNDSTISTSYCRIRRTRRIVQMFD